MSKNYFAQNRLKIEVFFFAHTILMTKNLQLEH